MFKDHLVEALKTSSWLWGSKTTCRVRYVVSEKPQVVLGADQAQIELASRYLYSFGSVGKERHAFSCTRQMRAFVNPYAKNRRCLNSK